MKKIFTVLMLTCISGVAVGSNETEFLAQKFKEWFSEAKATTKPIFLTDAKGCLYSAYDAGNGIQLTAMLDPEKKPVCRK